MVFPHIARGVDDTVMPRHRSSPERAGKVDRFCSALSDAGLSVVRDIDVLGPGDRISPFMRELGNSDRTFVFLSDAYLTSPNCMYELLRIWQNSGDDPERFRQRTRVFIMPGTDINSPVSRLKYVTYWKKQRDEMEPLIREAGTDLGPTELKNVKYILEFAIHVSEMLAQIADVLHAGDLDRFIQQAIAESGGPAGPSGS